MNIFVDYSLFPVSCFRKASFLEKSIQSDQKPICRRLPRAKEVRLTAFSGRIIEVHAAPVSAEDEKRLVTFRIDFCLLPAVSSALLPSVCLPVRLSQSSE